MKPFRLALLVGVLGLQSPLVFASSAPPRAPSWEATVALPDTLKVNGLGVLHGKATAWDPKSEILTFVTEEGKVHRIPAAKLDRLSSYKLAKSKVGKEDAEGQVKLGNFARSIELYAHAGKHYHYAVQLDPTLADAVEQERTVNRQLASEYCLRRAKTALAKRDRREAEKWLTTIVDKLPGEPQAKIAASMLNEIYPANHAAKDDDLESKYSAELEKDLKRGKGHYDGMLAKIHKGLSGARSTNAANALFEGAWRDGEKALAELKRVQKKRGGEEQLTELFTGYRALIHEHMVAAQLHLAANYSTQTSYKQALKEINRALSIDPGNLQALSARARVEVAVSRGGPFRRWW